jgi:hypothetical protein
VEESRSALPAAVTMARRLTPSVLVFENVDLVAEDRAYGHGVQPLRFELLTEQGGHEETGKKQQDCSGGLDALVVLVALSLPTLLLRTSGV